MTTRHEIVPVDAIIRRHGFMYFDDSGSWTLVATIPRECTHFVIDETWTHDLQRWQTTTWCPIDHQCPHVTWPVRHHFVMKNGSFSLLRGFVGGGIDKRHTRLGNGITKVSESMISN